MEDRSSQLYAVTLSVLLLVWISAFLRSYVRAFIVKSFGVDDWLMIFSALTFSMYCGFVLTGLHYGTGRHSWDLAESNMLTGIRYWYFCEWAYAISTTAMKVAIGAFFLRIAVDTIHTQIIWMIMIVNVLFGFSYFMCAVLQCVPARYIWLKFAAHPPPSSSARCISDEFQVRGSIAHSVLCAVSDWTLALLPIAMLWGTTMNLRTRAIVLFLMGLGALASTATIVRITYLHTVDTKTDFLWVTFDVAIWSTVEGVGIVANGLATLRPLFRVLLSSTGTARSSYPTYSLDTTPLSAFSLTNKKAQRFHMSLEHSTRLSCSDLSSISGTTGVTPGSSNNISLNHLENINSNNMKELDVESAFEGVRNGEITTTSSTTGGNRDLGRRSPIPPPHPNWDLNETSRWRPDSYKLGQFTTTVIGGIGIEASIENNNNHENNTGNGNGNEHILVGREEEMGTMSKGGDGRKKGGNNRSSSRDPGGRKGGLMGNKGITKVTEFCLEERRARLSELRS